MSRSYKKTKIFGNCKGRRGSDKPGKKIASRILRSKAKQELKTCTDWDNFVPVIEQEAFETWNMPSDGKHFWCNAQEKDMRK